MDLFTWNKPINQMSKAEQKQLFIEAFGSSPEVVKQAEEVFGERKLDGN